MQEKTRICLIDADTILYVACYHNRDNNDEARMLRELDEFILSLLVDVQADKYAGFVKGPDPSYRHKAFPDYKANRPPAPDWLTKWKPVVTTHLVDPAKRWKFEEVNGIEVDDAVASAHWQLLGDPSSLPIICSQDKDFNQLPGWHYNPKKREMVNIIGADAWVNLLSQILTGDPTDNIKGLSGIGPAKAAKILNNGADGVNKLYEVITAYLKDNPPMRRGLLDFVENAFKVILREDSNFKFTLQTFDKQQEHPLEKEIRENDEAVKRLFS